MRKINRSGYWYVHLPQHPNSGKQGYIAEHRLVMEQTLGRNLLPSETVHHKDEDRRNNSPDNLELYKSNGEHTRKAHPEIIEILRTINIGIRRSPETEFKKGHTSWNRGLTYSDKTTLCKVRKCGRSAWYKNGGKKGFCSRCIQRLRRGRLSEDGQTT